MKRSRSRNARLDEYEDDSQESRNDNPASSGSPSSDDGSDSPHKRKNERELSLGIAEFPNLFFKQKKFSATREKNKNMHWPKLKKVYENEGYIDEKGRIVDSPSEVPNHFNLGAPRSTRLPRYYCDVTGFSAPYLDPKSHLRYAHPGIFQHIRLHLEPGGTAKKYLVLRGEIVELT